MILNFLILLLINDDIKWGLNLLVSIISIIVSIWLSILLLNVSKKANKISLISNNLSEEDLEKRTDSAVEKFKENTNISFNEKIKEFDENQENFKELFDVMKISVDINSKRREKNFKIEQKHELLKTIKKSNKKNKRI